MKKEFLLVVILLLSLPGSLFAVQDQAPKSGHPSVPAFPGFSITESERQDFAAHEFPTGPEVTRRVEGKMWSLQYEANEGARQASPLEIARNYKNAFTSKGGSVVYAREEGGVALSTFKLPQPGGELWADLDAREGYYTLVIVEAAGMDQKLELSADAMAKQLAVSGRVALHGILFDTGKSNIKPESQPTIAEIAKLLQADAALKLRIEGHTDNAGQKAANLALSKSRAASVKTALVALGANPDRLSTEGYGDTKPVADNGSETGRAQNRRVELVRD